MKEVIIYDITIKGIYKVEAKNSIDAINKAKEYVEENSGKLDYTWVAQTVYVEEEVG